jgi:tRNA/tmRNA/rRNA uracil-C5-methylase (TrmA/RlmC/RlmD family)
MQDPNPSGPPFQTGQRHVLHVQDLAFGGEGVGRLDDFVVFVPFTLVGEEVEVELTEVKRHFARARLLAVRQASPHRVAPRCPHFGECGGCQYQHVAYPEQLRLKHKQVTDLLQRLGGLPPTVVAPILPCPQPYGYRNRIMIRSQWNRPEQRLNLGFLRHDNRLVVDLETCAIAEPALNDQLRQTRAHPPPKGGLKVVLRLAPPDWELPRDSFFQNNFHLLPQLVQTVRARLESAGTRHLLDAYCGIGFFALELASTVESFLGVELDTAAIHAARRNAAARRITNGEFIVGRTEEQLAALLGRGHPAHTTVLLDPPRTGCARPAIEALRTAGPAQILYVSCHPATLARDLKALGADHRFVLEHVQPLDMFPQTQHVECVADLRCREA